MEDEDLYIKRITFYLFLCIQTVCGAAFVITDHVELRALKENVHEAQRWANDKIEASITDRANLRLELLKTGELKYSMEQCIVGVKNLQQELKEHEKETASRN